ncbi:MAG: hypothetical protein ACI32N_02455 [Bulleidia sp.]
MAAGLLAVSMAACSSSTASDNGSSVKEDETASRVTTEYSETVDAGSVEYKTETFHEVSYDMVNGWSPRRMSRDDGWTYLIPGQKDSIEVHYVQGNSDVEAMKAFIETDEMKEYCDAVVSSEEKEIAGLSGLYVEGITTVASTIMEDANIDFYMVPANEGFFFISFTYEPRGAKDYSAVYEKIVNSITIA